MITLLRGTSFVASAYLMLASAWAQDGILDTSRHDSSLPIEIAADSMEVEQSAQIATFLGAVDVKQGDLTLRSDTLIVHYRDNADANDNAIHLIEVIGNVFFATPNETAQGDSGTYNVDNAVITLIGNVVLTNSDAVMRGDAATMNLETGQSQVTGEGDRVNVLFNAPSSDEP
ncbi:MAG: lipopolysaccharide transport periplasmic protein LptA [Rhodospirillaceae bacterium]|nr:lipopolysaccharide transport periplasmic protein LptA [Rhodospirillaceae bacterium]|tara:strand:+ start:4723 stop:5241 length:519 start_codon:yes stop_codon:yes gene_type:complete